jgi:phospholipase C
MRKKIARSLALGLAGLLLQPAWAFPKGPPSEGTSTATPIQHLVVIFQENISFDHYFATYPNAANPGDEPPFVAQPGTPNVNGLSGALLTSNPNFLNSANGSGAINPFRLDRSQAATADQDHSYTPEQEAFDHGLMDLFPLSVGTAGTPPFPPPSGVTTKGLTMGYYDGNTVTALWNYAQAFAMSDNSYDTVFGPSTPGALNLISGQTNGAVVAAGSPSTVSNTDGSLTLTGDANPTGDMCSSGSEVSMTGPNIGDLLNAANVSWGWFHGGFDLSVTNPNGTTGCARTTTSEVTGVTESDYIEHHEPFQFYKSTQNLTHARPTVPPSQYGMFGLTTSTVDAANHQYDINDFFAALNANNLPAVSFLKAPGFQEGHAGYSDPLDEQTFIVTVINALQQSPQIWKSTAVVISWDDSDGWYDHQMSPILNQSASSMDALTGTGMCGTGAAALPGVDPTTLPHAQGRCGFGPRLPLLVISPYAKQNFVDHTLTNQSSIIRFVEDNWLGGTRLGQGSFDAISNSIDSMLDFDTKGAPSNFLILDPSTGEPMSGRHF